MLDRLDGTAVPKTVRPTNNYPTPPTLTRADFTSAEANLKFLEWVALFLIENNRVSQSTIDAQKNHPSYRTPRVKNKNRKE